MHCDCHSFLSSCKVWCRLVASFIFLCNLVQTGTKTLQKLHSIRSKILIFLDSFVAAPGPATILWGKRFGFKRVNGVPQCFWNHSTSHTDWSLCVCVYKCVIKHTHKKKPRLFESSCESAQVPSGLVKRYIAVYC